MKSKFIQLRFDGDWGTFQNLKNNFFHLALIVCTKNLSLILFVWYGPGLPQHLNNLKSQVFFYQNHSSSRKTHYFPLSSDFGSATDLCPVSSRFGSWILSFLEKSVKSQHFFFSGNPCIIPVFVVYNLTTQQTRDVYPMLVQYLPTSAAPAGAQHKSNTTAILSSQ